MKKSNHFVIGLITAIALLNLGGKTITQNYPEMVTVEGGSFIMGDEHSFPSPFNTYHPYELPLHRVTVSTFSIAKTETTVAQWSTFCNETGRTIGGFNSRCVFTDSFPVVGITWFDAAAYCNWLSKKTGHLYRLPTEAEYEYAARGGNKTHGYKYSGSDDADEVAWYHQKYCPCAVATKKPNELGLYDMSGNVMEWCNDWYDDNYYQVSPPVNPMGPPTGENRVTRGGYFKLTATYCQVASRSLSNPNKQSYVTGFRVVCVN